MKVKLGGVPEYFNLPIYDAVEGGHFHDQGLDVSWQDVKEGTGAMIKLLEERSLDMAIMLTEGAVKSIIEGAKIKLVKPYVKSPLTWGVHIPARLNMKQLSELKTKKIAISRENSGSHLMAYLLAEREGWNLRDHDFYVINNLEGAVDSFESSETNLFLWEKYTTEPYVDKGIFKRISTIPTPWSCFVIATNSDFSNKYPDALNTILEVISQRVDHFQEKFDQNRLIADRFGLKMEKVDEILKVLEWQKDTESTQTIALVNQVQDILFKLNMIPIKLPGDQFLI